MAVAVESHSCHSTFREPFHCTGHTLGSDLKRENIWLYCYGVVMTGDPSRGMNNIVIIIVANRAVAGPF